MRTPTPLYVALLALLGLPACSGTSADQACSDYAKAQCAKVDQCRKNGTQVTYGSLGVCITRQKLNCMNALAAPMGGNDPGFYEACALALPAENCQDYLQGNPIDACVSKSGTMAVGTACAFSTQCQTGFCAVLKGGNCGTCQNPPQSGDPCTDTGCARNQTCTPNLVCRPWVATGGTCDTKDNICAPGQACVIATGMTSGACKPKLNTVGATCDPKRLTGPDCDANAGLFCEATSLKCVAVGYGNASAACGVNSTSHTDTVCNAGGSCINPGSGAACVAAATEGSSCDTSAGPPCLAPSRCVTGGTGTSGTCMLLDGTMCM